MIFKKIKDISYILFMLPLFFLTEKVVAQCDVFIEPGSVQVTETSDAVMFTFDVTNNSTSEWMGSDVLMYWSLNSGVNIMSIQYGDGSDADHPPPLSVGETQTFSTPWMAIPNLPEWFPDNPGPGGELDDNWVDALDWPYWSANPNGFDGSWSQINLRLEGCGLGDGAWVYDDEGDPYYGPFNDSVCQDINNDAFCDCDINVTGYNQDSHVVSIEVNSSYNCGCNYLTDNNYMDCYNAVQTLENTTIDHLVFGLNVQTLDEDWLGCLNNSFHEGWVFGSLNFNFNPLESGDMVSEEINIYNDCWDTMQDLAPNSLCLQMVVWQINYSQTAYAFELYGGMPGWAATCGTCQYDTQEYPDIDIENNLVVWCFNDNPPEPDIPGCIDDTANNFNPDANIDDGTCEYDVFGCTDPVACNYNDDANIFDDSCIYCDPAQCIWIAPWCYGCLDPIATNYSEEAQIDDGSCEYANVDLSFDTLLYNVGCDNNGPYWSAEFYLTNQGLEPITEWCIQADILSSPEIDTICFDSVTIMPGETYVQTWPNIYDWGVLSVHVLHINGNSGLLWNQFGSDTDVADNMYVQIISNTPDCPYTDAKPIFYNSGPTCEDEEMVSEIHTTIQNIGTDTIFTYCISIPEINYDECFNGYEQPGYYIEPGGGQTIYFPSVPLDITTLSFSVYDVNNEPSNLEWNNSFTVNLNTDVPEDCVDAELIDYDAELFCDSTGVYYTPIIYFENTGFEDITEICISFNLYGSMYNETSCWEGILNSGDSESIVFPPIYFDSIGAYIDIASVNGESINYPVYVLTGMIQSWYQEASDLCTVFGCTDPEADNYNQYAEVDDGSCEIGGCTIIESCNYDPNATYNDDTCDFETCAGCMDPEASNYDPEATIDTPGICEYDILGCTDITAVNYNPFANVDDGSCIEAVIGCMIPSALNYNPLANVTCVPIEDCCEFPIPGCTDSTANNYNSEANVDDGSCEYDIIEINYVNGECSVDCDQGGPYYYVTATFQNTGNITVTDFCVEWDVIGGEEETECFNGSLEPGQTTTINFGPIYTDGTGIVYVYLLMLNGVDIESQVSWYETLFCMSEAESVCIYGCTDPEANNYNEDADINDESCEYDVFGCTDSTALNYNPFANIDDGSCEYEVYGCTDPEALNYNPLATVDNGTCVYQEPCDSFTGSVYISNSFTPDNDGINDLWRAFTVQDCWNKWELTILNRWGGVIWYSTNPSDEWDGTFKDNGEYVQNGMYVYKLKALTTNLNYVNKNGYIMVIR